MARYLRAAGLLAGCLLLALGLFGCAAADTPSGALTGKGKQVQTTPQANLPAGVYLASLTVTDVTSEFGIAIAIEPQVATFVAGDLQFVVINKWIGLSPGSHREVVRTLAPDGVTELYQEVTDFEIRQDSFSLTIAEPMTVSGAVPGIYHISVELDGREVLRYPFRVVPEDATSP